MDFTNILIVFGSIIILWIIGKMFSVPLRIVFKIILNSVLGGALIFVINLIGNIWNFHIGLNYLTALCVGILGIPRSNFTYTIANFSLNIKQKSISYFGKIRYT